MTTNYHTAIATGAAANAATVNSPMGDLDAAVSNKKPFLSPMAFYHVLGSPSQGYVGAGGGHAAGSWQLDDSAIEYVGTTFEVPEFLSGSSISVRIWFAMESAVSGAVLLVSSLDAIDDGENFAVTGGDATAAITVPGTAKYLDSYTFAESPTYTAGDLLRLRVGRSGSNGSDTATGDLHFLGVSLEFN